MQPRSPMISRRPKPFVGKAGLFKYAITALLFLALIFSFARAWNYAGNFPGYDFYQFWVVGEAVSAGEAGDIYSEEVRRTLGEDALQEALKGAASDSQIAAATYRSTLETFSTPFLYSTFSLFSFGDYDGNLKRYHLLSFASFIFAVVVFCRILSYGTRGTLVMLLLFSLWFEPFLSEVRGANTNSIQLGLLALFMLIQSRHEWRYGAFVGGLVLGFSIIFKPNVSLVLFLLALSWFLNRRYRQLLFGLLGAGTSSFLAYLYSAAFFGSFGVWDRWSDAIGSMPSGIITMEMGNFAIPSLVSALVGINIGWYFLLYLLLLAAVFILLERRKRDAHVVDVFSEAHEEGAIDERVRGLKDDFRIVALGSLIYLFGAPLVWIHYFILAIPMFIFAFRPKREGNFLFTDRSFLILRGLLPACAFLLIATRPVSLLLDISSIVHLVTATTVGTFILFILALSDFLIKKSTPPSTR